MRNLRKLLNSRLAKNVYFWIFVIAFMYTLNSSANAYPKHVYLQYKLATTTLLLLLTYTNNLLIVPYTLAKRKYLVYVVGVVVELCIFSIAYLFLLKKMLLAHPDIHIYEVSLITSPISTDFSIGVFLDEMLIFAFGLFMWLMAFTTAWYMQAYGAKERQAAEAKQKQTEVELRMLRNQISPHFLFNTLNNIYGLSLKKSDAAPESILKLSSLMRYMLYDANQKLMPFEKEKEVMQAYIDMELLRLDNKERLKFHVAADHNYEIPALLWLPILENAFKYATRVITTDYFIDYSFTINEGEMIIKSSNSYKAQIKQDDSAQGLGLANFRKRLDILYGSDYTISENKEENVYDIKVTIKL